MCGPLVVVPLVMAAMSAAQGAMSAHDQAKATGAAMDQQNKQKAQLIKQMNIENANSDLQTKDDLQQSFVRSSDINLQGVHNEGVLRAAIGESMLSGHSMDRLMNNLTGDEARAQADTAEEYQRKYQSNYTDKLSRFENTKAQVNGMAPVPVTSKLAQAVSITTGAIKTGAAAYAGGAAGGATTAGQVMGGMSGGFSAMGSQ